MLGRLLFLLIVRLLNNEFAYSTTNYHNMKGARKRGFPMLTGLLFLRVALVVIEHAVHVLYTLYTILSCILLIFLAVVAC